MFKGLIAFYHGFKWLLRFKRNIEAKGSSRFSPANQAQDRLWLEKVFRALETGNTDGLPRVIEWLFANTDLDNKLGSYGQGVLKSNKLAEHKEILDQPLEKGLRW